ncbi:hypothetical protein [Streptomyces sp. AD55]|uniref:hypothetical protein n=1 Tax=Streptomyces sp. AD55 TaxID=3242895 RepID=UPI0035287A98
MSTTYIPAAGPVFQEGDRVLCADGMTRTVKAMAPLVSGEPAHVVVEDGTEWIAANCRRANPADIHEARRVSRSITETIRRGGPDDPQWRAARADLNAMRSYLVLAQTEEDAPREPEHRTAPAQSEGERALREEIAALFVALSQDGRAHAFQRVQPHGATYPLAWTYRTGYGAAARYGWVMAGGRLQTERAAAEYRWQAEEDAVESIRVLAIRGEGSSTLVDTLAHASLAELRTAVDRLRDRTARTRGTHPRYVLDENVRAALEVLAACHFAEVPNDFNPAAEVGAEDHDSGVTGLLVEPRGNGHVAAYWVQEGQYVQSDGRPWSHQLRDLRRKFEDAGWTVVPGGRRVVTACRPTS